MRELYEKLPGALLPWYEKNHRDLPWRKDQDPYHIWVSEIMLQQTRVEAVKGYYQRFLKALPTIESLANAPEEQLYKLWEGLGYYSRVRNLQKAAKAIVEQHNGVFPKKYSQVLALPGIGAYTAGAICSIAYGMPTPAVDGNVLRVASRITNDTTPIDLPVFKKTVIEHLAAVYPAQAGAFTQALMELGATVCGPNRKPDCEICPCNDLCMAYKCGTAETLPVKQPKRQRRTENRTVLILTCDGSVGLQKRPGKGLLAGMWQFPNVTGHLDVQGAMDRVEEIGLKPKELRLQVEKKHIFTHVEWDMRGYYIEVSGQAGDLTWKSSAQMQEETALPTAFRQFWEGMTDV